MPSSYDHPMTIKECNDSATEDPIFKLTSSALHGNDPVVTLYATKVRFSLHLITGGTHFYF